DGQVSLAVNGGTAPYNYAWSNGSNTADLMAGAGTYTVNITDANNCTVNGETYVIGSNAGPVAAADAEQTIVSVGIPVVFINNRNAGDSYSWEFGDGQTSDEIAPSHAYATPGTYTVTLTVSNGSCTSTTTVTITVEVSTGITSNTDITVRAWLNGD